QPDQRGEDHERHHSWLQQREVIGDTRLRDPGRQLNGFLIDNRHDTTRFVGCAARERAAHIHMTAYCTFGRVENWWNGGGEDSVHSSVVAPSPHGLSAACCLRAKASTRP